MKSKTLTAEELGILLFLNSNKLPIDNLKDLENIETEMKCIHYAQTNNIIENNLMVYYSGDGCTVQMYSCKNFHISLGLPQRDSNFVYIRNLYVPQDLRCMNVGTKVFIETLKQAKERGCNSIQVEATKTSFNFWCKLGFQMLEVKNLRMIYYV